MVPSELVVHVRQIFIVGVDEAEPLRIRHLADFTVHLAVGVWGGGGVKCKVWEMFSHALEAAGACSAVEMRTTG